MTEVAEAQALILANMPSFGSERLPLAACVGRVLREDVRAERDQPPFDRVTMDGIAIAHRDWTAGVRDFTIVGTQAAGTAALAVAAPGQCVEVMTGAMLPAGTDTVVPVERVERRGELASVAAERIEPRQFVHARGSDRAAASLLLPTGTRIGAPEMAVLTSSGRDTAAVDAIPQVVVISTGNELVDVGEPLASYQIRSSNDRAIEATLTAQRLALVRRVWLEDDAAKLERALVELHESADVIILSGGVSMGRFDFVPAALAQLGAETIFHRVRQRPGKPMWFGVSAQRKPIFALPGNPVSTLICTSRYVLPALRSAAGLAPPPTEHAVLTRAADASPELTYFLPVKLSSSPQGVLLAEPRPTNTSGDFISLAGTDGFVELPAAESAYPAGAVARLFRW